MTAFYLPGITGETSVIEGASGEIRRQLELDVGRRPTPRRIVRLGMRRGAVDCQQEPGSGDGVREALGCEAYSVLAFDA